MITNLEPDILECEVKSNAINIYILHRSWNVRSKNQDKLEEVKKEMARVNIDILRISESKWMGMGEFNLGNYYIYFIINY